MNLYQPTITGSLSVSGSINISGSINVVGGGGTITGTASYASNADLLDGAHLSILATTGSNTFTAPQTINSNLTVTGSITTTTLVVQTITSSIDYVTGSTRFGSLSSNTMQVTGSVLVSGSLIVSGTMGTGDLALSNQNIHPNEIDGTFGNWLIQEGKDDLFIINQLSGKKYKFNLIEIE
jgi:hypothetical protein